ncbi:MAG: hypothetical protein ABSH05_00690 [Bryobacteraceae bacterium]
MHLTVVHRWVLPLVFLVAEYPLPAQYPGSGYPPGQYPGAGVPGIPRRSKQKKTPADAGPSVSVSGILRSLDAKELVVEAQDTRILTLKRTETTKFYKNSAEAKPADFKAGDHLLVEATQDDQGFLYAATVTWQKAGSAEEQASASKPAGGSVQKPSSEDGPPVLRRADSPRKEETLKDDEATPAAAAPEPEPERPQIRDAQPPIRVGADDPGPPVLRHGAPARRTTIEPPAETAPVETAALAPPPSTPLAPVPEPPKADSVIEKARSAALAFDEKLPNYICEQFTARFQSASRPVDWRPQDILSAEVVYEEGREHYRNLKINGKQSVKSMEETGGAWSKGEYGSVLADLFSPSTDAEFRRRGGDTIAGLSAVVYDFSVEREHSHWSIHAPSQLVQPAYRGSVWVDPRSGRVLRIEMQARRIPQEFPFDTIESTVDYQYIRLGGPGEFLLPVHAEILSCQRGSSMCARNVIDFRNYHHYTGESKITYGP